MSKRLVAALCVLAFAGCEDGAPEANRTEVKIANPQSDQLEALSEDSRKLAFYRAVRDSGQHCKRVDSVAYQEEYKNMALWLARCSDSGDWQVYIAPAGDVQVRPCRSAATLDLPECRALPEAEDARPSR